MENKFKMIRHIILCSGGKDSITMGLLLEEKNPDTDYIWLFCDSGIEYPGTLKIIKKLPEHIRGKLIILKSKIGWDDIFYKKVKTGDRITGFPTHKKRWCTRIFKQYAAKHVVRKEDVQYMGFAANEKKRSLSSMYKKGQFKFPLIEWDLDEDYCKEYCEKKGLLADLYEHFSRNACMFCPFKRIQEWYNLWKFYPEIWKIMKKYEEDSPHGLFKDKTLKELEERFKKGIIFLRENQMPIKKIELNDEKVQTYEI